MTFPHILLHMLFGIGGAWFQKRDRGATAVEYALMASLIAAVIVVAVGALGLSVAGLFQSFLTEMGWGVIACRCPAITTRRTSPG